MEKALLFITAFVILGFITPPARAQDSVPTATVSVPEGQTTVVTPAAPTTVIIQPKEDKGPPMVGRKPPHDAITGEIVTDEKETAYDPFKDKKKEEESLRDKVRAKLKD